MVGRLFREQKAASSILAISTNRGSVFRISRPQDVAVNQISRRKTFWQGTHGQSIRRSSNGKMEASKTSHSGSSPERRADQKPLGGVLIPLRAQ
jgi:hypothetical protein